MRLFRLTVFLIACLLLASASALAFGEIAYSDRPLNLRSSRSPKSEWVGMLYAGQKVRISDEQDGWVAVYEPDETDPSKVVGYSNTKYLLAKRGRYEPKEWGQLVFTPNKLNIRQKPSVKSRKVGVLQPKARVIIDFPEDQWTMVFSPEATIRSRMNGLGFCSSHYFQPVTDKTGSAPRVAAGQEDAAEAARAEDESQAAGQDMAYTDTRRLTVARAIDLRQSRTETSPLIRPLSPGEEIQVGLLRDGWYAVFAASDFIRSESSSLGYAQQSQIDQGAELVPPPGAEPASEAAVEPTPEPEPTPETAAEPTPESVVEPKPVSVEAIKAEAIKPKVQEPAPAPEPVRQEVAAKADPAPPKPAPKPEPKPEPAKAKPEPKPEPVKEAAPRQQTMVIDRSAFVKTKRPDPIPDQTVHGYHFRFIEKSETRQFGQPWITLKVFLATDKLPDREALKDFATTLWQDHKRVTKNVAVHIYLPGMDLEDLAYAVIRFDDEKLLELWVRKAALFGTKFM